MVPGAQSQGRGPRRQAADMRGRVFNASSWDPPGSPGETWGGQRREDVLLRLTRPRGGWGAAWLAAAWYGAGM